VHGAQVACADFTSNGNGTALYDPKTLGNLTKQGAMVRVPGSWRDF
jgi:hypothetical protein